ATTAATSTADTASSSSSTVLNEANMTSCRGRYSLGAISRDTKGDSPENRVPSTMPTSTMAYRSREPRRNSSRNSSTEKATITATSRPNLSLGSVWASIPAPNRNTTTVWMSTNSESKPMTDGVRMRLPVTVWNSTVE